MKYVQFLCLEMKIKNKTKISFLIDYTGRELKSLIKHIIEKTVGKQSHTLLMEINKAWQWREIHQYLIKLHAHLPLDPEVYKVTS